MNLLVGETAYHYYIPTHVVHISMEYFSINFSTLWMNLFATIHQLTKAMAQFFFSASVIQKKGKNRW